MIDEITALRVENERLAAELAKAEALSREQVAGAYLAAEERLAMEQGALITRRVISAINSLTPADATAALEARDARVREDAAWHVSVMVELMLAIGERWPASTEAKAKLILDRSAIHTDAIRKAGGDA
ncbi:hypothetical protein [Paenirhodobacter sp. CAU 1674]|uniref:hypothetical protein n=1 Tax=Paenirhodobacter sp. CAU 1674 TaxID=3032596 RepID=UPI0023DC50AC|nr:hypothetical protein [Paenirhodobacter sp. CAU 1674]MDF2140820.1 hypothetical protein [Paenirhodobacter sp. CAU 1674]